MTRPARRIGAGGSQHPFAEPRDEAGLLGDRNELGRCDHTTFGMMPAHQCFAATDLIRLEVDNRLVIDLELAPRERLTEVELEIAPDRHARIHLGLEEPVYASTGPF